MYLLTWSSSRGLWKITSLLTRRGLVAFLVIEWWLPLESVEFLDGDSQREVWITKRNRVKTQTITMCHLLGDAALRGIGRGFSGCLSSDVLSNDVALHNLRGSDWVPLEIRLFDNKAKVSYAGTSWEEFINCESKLILVLRCLCRSRSLIARVNSSLSRVLEISSFLLVSTFKWDEGRLSCNVELCSRSLVRSRISLERDGRL
jgi:hypothetical protein